MTMLARQAARMIRPLGALGRSRSLVSAPPENMTYSERMAKTNPNRPISPHLTIYKLPMIAWSSVTVRITGAMASFGFFGLAGATLVGGSDFAMDTVQDLSSLAPAPLKFAVAFVLSYQWFGSARHAYWDLTAKGFHNATMHSGAVVMFGITGALSLALAAYSPSPHKKPSQSSVNAGGGEK
jgi:succinate dehydrogenase cytochrome b556 subunit